MIPQGLKGEKSERIGLCEKDQENKSESQDESGLKELSCLSSTEAFNPVKGQEEATIQSGTNPACHTDINSQNTHLQGNDRVTQALMHCVSPEHNSVIFSIYSLK